MVLGTCQLLLKKLYSSRITKRMSSILILGDKSDWESYQKFRKSRKIFKKKNIEFKTISYDSILKNRLPTIKSRKLLILLFFPLDYWNNEIEKDFVRGRVYGDRKCADMFYSYMDNIKKILSKKYSDNQISYVNSFESIKIDRDKELTKKILKKAGIRTPRSYTNRNYRVIMNLLKKGERLYIKVNFGAMGKGITKLEKNRWTTNFIYRRNSIISRKSDYGWRFKDITGNKNFLKELLKKDVIIEKAVNPYIINKRWFDIRYYVVYGKIKHKIIRSTRVHNIVTNITQGGHIEDADFIKEFPPKSFKEAEQYALKAAKSLNLNLSGIDIIFSKRGLPYVLEVQSFPGFPKTTCQFSEKLARDIINNY